MFRNLKAIEIAEGALLADMAVVFQLIAAFLPVGSSFFYMLICVVFTILVLRRDMYVAAMGLCVALFMVSIVIGPQYAILQLLEGMGGIFLGLTMKHRLPYLLIVLFGTLSGAFAVYCLLFFFSLLTGFSFNSFILSIHQAYDLVIPFIATLCTRLGLGSWWRAQFYPLVSATFTFAFAYWWLTLYMALVAIFCPVVAVIYTMSNFFVRLLGYDVPPFPGGWLEKRMHRLLRWLLKRALHWKRKRKRWSKA